jgi:hypothetical protein
MKNIIYTTVIIFSLLISPPIVAEAQVASGGNFSLTQSVVASGGGTNSGGGSFSLSGTTGQSVAGGAMSGSTFEATSGFWNFSPASIPNAPAYEADVASRPNGNGLIQSNDVVQIRRFLNSSDALNPATGEFQRADSAPYSTRGDGILASNDVVQARRYITTDALQAVDGPVAPLANANQLATAADAKAHGRARQSDSVNDASRQLRVESTSAAAGGTATVNIRVDATGDEAEYAFVLEYESGVLSNPVVGNGNAGALLRDCNAATTGRISCSVGGFPNNNPASGNTGIGEINNTNNQILLTVTFAVAANAVPGATTPLTLTNVNASNDATDLFLPTVANGTVTIAGPTAASVSVSGRVASLHGKGIRNVRLTLTSAKGESQTVLSGEAGHYEFADVSVGETYILTITAKHYTFTNPSQVINVNEEISEYNFVGVSNGLKR